MRGGTTGARATGKGGGGDGGGLGGAGGGASGGVESGEGGSMGGKASRKERSVAVGGGVVVLEKGNEFLSKMTWREIMILCVVRSRQR